MKWPADISLFINDDGPPIDIWHDGVCGGPMLTANSMDAAQAIIGAIEELHGLCAEVADLRDRNLDYQQALHDIEQEYGTARAEIADLRAAYQATNTEVCQTLAAAMGCYPHAPDENGNEDLSAPYVVEPALAEDVAMRAAEMIVELRAERDNLATTPTATITTLQMQIADLQLALAAERLDPTAGTDLDYHLINGVYIRRVEGGHIEVEMRDEPKGRWRAYRFAIGLVVPPWREVWADNARTAMREANKKEKP